MSKYQTLSVKDLAQRLMNFGVVLKSQNESFAKEVVQPQSASDWIEKITSEILGNKNIVLDLRLGEDKIKKQDGISVNDIFRLMDDAHSSVVRNALEQLKKTCPIGAMYAIEEGNLTLQTENSCLFMDRDEDGYDRWLSEHEFDDENNVIAEPNWPAPSLDWMSRSGQKLTDSLRVMQELLTAFQWTCDFLDCQKQNKDANELIVEYLKNASKIYTHFNKNSNKEDPIYFVDGKLFNPLKEYSADLSVEKILKYYYRYPSEVDKTLVASGHFNDEHFLATDPMWNIFYGYKDEEKIEVEKIYKDSFIHIKGKNEFELDDQQRKFIDSFLWKYYDLKSYKSYINELEQKMIEIEKNFNNLENEIIKQDIQYQIQRYSDLDFYGQKVREIFQKVPPQFKPLIQYVNYYSVNGFNGLFFNHNFHSLFYKPLHIEKNEINKVNRPIWTDEERKNTIDSLFNVVSMLVSVLNQPSSRYSATEQSWIDAAKEIITLFNFMANLLNCLFYADSEFCSVCYRTKSNKKYCSKHTVLGTETPELRWAQNIQDYFVPKLSWHENECLFFEKNLLVNPAATLNSVNNYLGSITCCIEGNFNYLNSKIYMESSSEYFDVSKIDDVTPIQLNVLSRQLHLLRKISMRPLDAKIEHLYSILVWEYTHCSNLITKYAASLREPKIKPHEKLELESKSETILKIKSKINLCAFIKIWFYGIKNFFIHNDLSPQTKKLLESHEFQWLSNGFDKYSTVFISSSDNPNYDLLVKSIIRQSVWMNVDLILQNEPSFAKIDPVKVFNLYRNGTPLKDIGAILSPANPVSESTLKTILHRYIGKEFTKDNFIHLKQAVTDLENKNPNKIVDLSKLTASEKKFIINHIVSKLELGIVAPSSALTNAINEYLKSKA